MAAAGVPMRTLQEWMGHSDHSTTLIYADYAPMPREVDLAERAFASGVPGNWDFVDTTANQTTVSAEEADV